MNMVPKRLFFTKGVGKHKERLTSFELALRDAGIAAQNLVRVSSIFPPHCKLISRKEGLKFLNPGEVVFAVVAENSTREAHRLVVSSIGVAIPADKSTYGYLSEHHSFGETEDQAGDYAEELAAEMLATLEAAPWEPTAIEAAMKQLGETRQWSVKENFMLLRAILTGSATSPPLTESLVVFGKSRSLDRMRRFLEAQKKLVNQRK